jgi:hypothetical protein
MSTYKITPYSLKQAKKLKVDIKPSTNKKKKIDVFKDGQKIASIGATGYNDYPTWIAQKGTNYANERRRLYKSRHDSTRHTKDINSFYADKILW